MAEQTDFDMYGRKIFFLNPAYAIKKDIISSLRKKEYEVYIIESFRDAKNLLRKNPDSVLFINIDAQLSIGAWFNFLRSFDKEESLKTIQATVISEKIKPNEIELFSKFSDSENSVIDFSDGIEKVSERIQNILTKTNAKGRRQYIRANLMHDKDAALFWNHGSKMHQLKLFDLSSVGMAVKIPAGLESLIIAKNYILQDVTIRLGTKQVVTEAVVFAVKKTEQGTIWVLLLAPQTSAAVKNEIRRYVFKTIEDKMILSINEERKDDTDYAQMDYYNFAAKTKSKSKPSTFSSQPGHNFS
ncbi:hypothetical protein [uncultured Treponema sp.]|uniref:hypothetical protein n=1 Tax=uncultured Treponema sp. TaxID=162155 RepID=UPI0028048C72|nr:hypothetical protein [uncultured Treponema sp.]